MAVYTMGITPVKHSRAEQNLLQAQWHLLHQFSLALPKREYVGVNNLR